MSGPGPSCCYCQLNPCDHDGLWREYHDLERALREKDAELKRLRDALRDMMHAMGKHTVACSTCKATLRRHAETLAPLQIAPTPGKALPKETP